MGDVKKKKEDSTEKVEQQDTTKVEKKKPIKAGSTHQGDTGGIFTSKVAAIVRMLKGKARWVSL